MGANISLWNLVSKKIQGEDGQDEINNIEEKRRAGANSFKICLPPLCSLHVSTIGPFVLCMITQARTMGQLVFDFETVRPGVIPGSKGDAAGIFCPMFPQYPK